MKRIALFTVIALLICMMGACDRPEFRRLQRAEAVMESAPDSALAILDSIDTATLTHASDRALYALLLTQSRIKTYDVLTADSLVSTAVRYYEDHGPDSNLMKSLFYQGEILSNNREFSKAIIPSMRAREMAISADNPYWHAKASELIGDMLNQTFYYSEAIVYSRESASLYEKVNKVANHRFALCDVAIDYSNIGAHKRSLEIIDSIRQIALQNPSDSNLVYYTNSIIFANYYHAKDFRKAIAAYDSLLNSPSRSFISQNDHIWGAISKMEEGDMADIDSLVELINDNRLSIDDCYKYEILSRYYFASGDYRKSKLYTDSAMFSQDTVVVNMLRQSVITSQRDFFSFNENLARSKAERLSTAIVVGAVFFLVVIVALIVFYVQRMKIKNMKVEQSMNEIYLLTTDLTSKNEDIRNLQSRIRQQGSNLQSEIESAFKNNWSILNTLCRQYVQMEESGASGDRLVKEVFDQVSQMRKPEKLDWIRNSVDRYKNGIIARLRQQCPFLKESDITFISLLYAGFSAKVICFFLEMGNKNFYAKRSRLTERIRESDAKDKEEFIESMNQKSRRSDD